MLKTSVKTLLVQYSCEEPKVNSGSEQIAENICLTLLWSETVSIHVQMYD